MVSWILSRVVVLLFGMLYPAYASYKAVKTKNIREYVRWMMYWIVFALFMAAETITDIFLPWLPFYYELKMAFVLWLLSPYTRGAGLLYRSFVHPTLSRNEKEIDLCIVRAREQSYETMLRFGRRGLNMAATAAVHAAAKSQGALAGRLRSFSMQDLRCAPDETPLHYRDPLYLGGEEEQQSRGAPLVCRVMESETEEEEEEEEEEERWSDGPKSAPHNPDPRPPLRSHSLRAARRKAPSKEGSARGVRARVRKKVPPPDQDS